MKDLTPTQRADEKLIAGNLEAISLISNFTGIAAAVIAGLSALYTSHHCAVKEVTQPPAQKQSEVLNPTIPVTFAKLGNRVVATLS